MPFTVSYEVNPDGSGLDPEDVISTLGESLETWDDAILGTFELFNEAIHLEIGKPLTPGDLDYRNIVVWEDLSFNIWGECYCSKFILV